MNLKKLVLWVIGIIVVVGLIFLIGMHLGFIPHSIACSDSSSSSTAQYQQFTKRYTIMGSVPESSFSGTLNKNANAQTNVSGQYAAPLKYNLDGINVDFPGDLSNMVGSKVTITGKSIKYNPGSKTASEEIWARSICTQ